MQQVIVMIINIPRPQTKLKAKPYQNNASLYSTVVIAPIGGSFTPCVYTHHY
jgi:hypothetical protein